MNALRFLLMSCLSLFAINNYGEQAHSWVHAVLLDDDGTPLNNSDTTNLPVPGQRITLALDVYTETWFNQAPQFPRLHLPEAITLQHQGFAINLNRNVNGKRYAVQRREYSLFTQRAGQFVIDGAKVTIQTATTEGTPGVQRTLRSNPLLLQIAPLAFEFTDQASSTLVANEVLIKQRFTTSLTQLRVGDVVQRHIDITATSTLGMLIPPLSWPTVAGLAQASSAPEVNDKQQRGQFIGQRTETRHYTLLQSGEYLLPAVNIHWWHAKQQRWQQTTLPAQPFSVVESSFSANNETPTAKGVGYISPLYLLPILGIAVLYFLLRRLRTIAPVALKRGQQSEPALYGRLKMALYKRNAQAVITHYYQWQQLPVINQLKVPAELQKMMVQVFASSQIQQTIDTTHAKRLATLLRQQRKQAKTSTRHIQAKSTLPAINPHKA